MSKKNIFGSVISEYSAHLSGAKIKEFESEDPLSKNLLRQRLCEVNSKRIVFFTVPAIVLSIVFAVINIASYTLAEQIPSLAGLALTAAGCGGVGGILYREYGKRKTDIDKSERLIFIYWTVFSAAIFLLTVSDFTVNVFAYRFYLYLIVMTVVPLFDLKRSLILICPYLALTVIFGCVFGADILILVLSAVFSFAYLIVSSLVYSSYCCLFISDRQLNIANERCRQINEKDGPTGLLNKKGLTRRLNDIINGGTENNIAAIFFDIDDFRRYNHIYTDSESDECLYNICNCVRIVSKPKTDIISRYGGDEFVIIVQDITEYDLIYFAEQIRKSVERMAVPFESGRIVTVSVGVSSIYEGSLGDYSRLLKEAENNLTLAKNGGKNCVGYMGNVFKVK
ncbi:MAG: GGDEF domain-containing protein [Bacteroides sp.]|nr:GGDEF domain-containing protein [Bacteroides sp.]